MTRKGVSYLTLNFTDGMDSTSNKRLIPPTKATVAQNIDFSVNNQFSKWAGYTKLNSASGAGTPLGLWEFTLAAGTRYAMMALSNGSVYKMDNLDGTWDYITSSSGSTTGTSYRYNAVTFNNEVYILNGVDTPKYWTGSAYATVDSKTGEAPPTDAEIIEQCWGYLFCNSPAAPSVLYRSEYYDGGNWLKSTNYYYIDKDDATQITGMKAGKKILYIWKEKSLHSLNLVDSNTTSPTFKRYRLFEIGCCAHKTIAKSPHGIIWSDGEKVYLWDEQSYPVEISQDIRTDIASFAKGQNAKQVGCWVGTKNEYWLSVAYGSVSVNNRIYTCTFADGKYKWAYKEVSANDMAIFNNGGAEQLYFAESGATGYVYRANYGDTFATAAFTGQLKTKWFTPQDFGLESDRAYLDSLDITATADGAWEVQVGYEFDYNPTSTTYNVDQNPGSYLIGTTYIIGVTPFGGGKEEVRDFRQFKGVSFKSIRFVFKNTKASQPFTIKEVRIGVKPQRRK